MKMIIPILICTFIASGCSNNTPPAAPAAKASAADSAEMDYETSLVGAVAPVGRFQPSSSSTLPLILTDTALGDVYIWRGSHGWLKYPSPLRPVPPGTCGSNDVIVGSVP